MVSSVAVFYAIRLSGGDAVSAVIQPGSASLEAREQLRDLWGLNLPIHEQYFDYMGRLLRGDLGVSLTNSSPISQMLVIHGRHSLILGATALGLVIVFLLIPWLVARFHKVRFFEGFGLTRTSVIALLAGATVIRFLPPLVISKKEIDTVVAALEEIL